MMRAWLQRPPETLSQMAMIMMLLRLWSVNIDSDIPRHNKKVCCEVFNLNYRDSGMHIYSTLSKLIILLRDVTPRRSVNFWPINFWRNAGREHPVEFVQYATQT